MKRNTLHAAFAAAAAAAQVRAPVRSVLRINARASNDADAPAELMIYGPIGNNYWGDSVSAQSIAAQLSGITAGTINVRINSDGGGVTEGIAIYNALKRHPARIVVTVDGIAASIASLIAMAGDEVVMPANTLMMLHAPWTYASGNAAQLREQAATLDVYAAATIESYAAKTNRRAEVAAVITDGRDHWYTPAEAQALGLCDRVLEAESEADESAAAAALIGYINAITHAPINAAATLRRHIQATATPTNFASLAETDQRAVLAQIEDPTMRASFSNILASAAGGPAASATPPAPTPAPTPAAIHQPAPVATPVPTVVAGADVPPQPTPAPNTRDIYADLLARNTAIRGVFAGFNDIAGIRELETTCLADPRMTVEQAQAQLLGRIGNGASPLAGTGGGPRIEAGDDEADRLRVAGVSMLMARAGMLPQADADAARQGNPYLNSTLIDMAERSLIRAGVNTRQMSRDDIARRVLSQQTTSDFPILLEGTLHRMVLTGYRLTPFTWSRFCATGTLSDYRPHSRYHLSGFSDLKPVNEAGEYENGVLGDGAKETIQGRRLGRILQITPEVLVNDDLGAFSRIATVLGQAAGRTIEKDVYAVLAMNAGMGPAMQDGKTLFHADHGNIAAVAAKPTVDSWDAARQQMGSQMDVGGNDFIDLSPAIWLGPMSLGTTARLINENEYNPDVSNKFAVRNTSRGMVRDVIDTARLTGTAWRMFADPNIEPVIEVAFLNGVQTPTIEQETNFRTDGLSWKVVHKYGVGAVGWRGALLNQGAA